MAFQKSEKWISIQEIRLIHDYAENVKFPKLLSSSERECITQCTAIPMAGNNHDERRKNAMRCVHFDKVYGILIKF